MNENQLIVINWIKEQNFMDAITELDGDYESVPTHVYDAYYELNYREKLEAIKEAINLTLKESDSFILNSK